MLGPQDAAAGVTPCAKQLLGTEKGAAWGRDSAGGPLGSLNHRQGGERDLYQDRLQNQTNQPVKDTLAAFPLPPHGDRCAELAQELLPARNTGGMRSGPGAVMVWGRLSPFWGDRPCRSPCRCSSHSTTRVRTTVPTHPAPSSAQYQGPATATRTGSERGSSFLGSFPSFLCPLFQET